jgi:hypothetical protein
VADARCSALLRGSAVDRRDRWVGRDDRLTAVRR